MAIFRRWLETDFVEALNKEYENGGWWKTIADHSKLTIAIRDNYLNIYHRGNSILKLDFNKGKLIGQTHYKYVLSPSKKAPYITWINGKPKQKDLELPLIESLDKVKELIAASKPYVEDEKDGVDTIIRANPNVIDVEIALSKLRIDFAAFQETGKGIELRFFEAKLFKNGELRAIDEKPPKVLGQITKYEELVRQFQTNILDSYLKTAQNFVDLKGKSISKKKRDICQQIVKLGSQGISVSDQPCLVIFGFDQDQKTGKAWTSHRKKLETALGSNRLLLIGNSENLTSGIKFNEK